MRDIFVIRDVPHSRNDTRDCVIRTVARGRNPALRCARPRAAALREDLAGVAAGQSEDERVKLIDLSDYMCDEQDCFPVVGGALVIKDIGHLTRTFSATLGPYLGREMNRPAGRVTASAAAFGPTAQRDPLEIAGDPLDLRKVTFGQRETQLELELHTQGEWSAADARRGRAVRRARARTAGRARLRRRPGRRTRAPLSPDREQRCVGEPRTIDLAVARKDQRSVFARLRARAIGLPLGRFAWRAESRLTAAGPARPGCSIASRTAAPAPRPSARSPRHPASAPPPARPARAARTPTCGPR